MRYATMCAVILLATGMAMGTATFEDIALAPESFDNGSSGHGDFTSGDILFNNNYDTLYGSWDGWAVSNITDNVTGGWGNQYSAIPGSGAEGSNNYGVSYIGFAENPTAALTRAKVFDGAYFTNTTYAYFSMLNGDAFSKKFGGFTGDDEDWLLLTIEGFDGATSTGTMEFYLADYRFADNGLDYIVDGWTWVDLTSLGAVTSLDFSLSSTDNGMFGMNTPGYFAMDGMVPEPVSMSLLALGGVALLRRRSRLLKRRR